MGEYEDMMDMGFEEVKPKPKRKKAPPRKKLPKKTEVSLPLAPEMIKTLTDSNEHIVAAMAQQNKIMQQELNKLVTEIKPKPSRMRVKVNRNSAGFMDSLDIDLEY